MEWLICDDITELICAFEQVGSMSDSRDLPIKTGACHHLLANYVTEISTFNNNYHVIWTITAELN